MQGACVDVPDNGDGLCRACLFAVHIECHQIGGRVITDGDVRPGVRGYSEAGIDIAGFRRPEVQLVAVQEQAIVGVVIAVGGLVEDDLKARKVVRMYP